MAIYTTDLAVAGIIEVDTDIPVDPFIESANALVVEICEPEGYDATRLELIERWLSAHMYAIRDPRALIESAGPVSTRYQSRVDLGFDVTHYGQMAMRLDTKGGLAALNEKIKSGLAAIPMIFWLGTAREVA